MNATNLNPENFIVNPLDDNRENFEIFEKVARETVDGSTVIIKEPRGTYNLPAMYGEVNYLKDLLEKAHSVISTIEANIITTKEE